MQETSQVDPSNDPAPDNTVKTRSSVRGHILFTFGVALALALAWKLRDTLTLIYVSALFAVVLTPLVQSIRNYELRSGHRLSRGAAIALLLGTVALGLALFFLVGMPPVIHDLHDFASDLPSRIPEILARAKRIPIVNKLGVDQLASKAESALSSTAAFLFASFPKWLGSLFDVLTGLILCIYFMLEGDAAYQWVLSLFSVARRKRLDTTLQRAELRISKWLIGQASLMLILGVCSTIVFAILHVRYFFLLGVLMGLMNIIPIAGGVITILVAAGVAALDSWTKMAGVFIFYTIYVNVENAYLTPRIMRSSVNLMGLTVLIALLAGTEIAGIVGALVAVPTAALIAVLMEEYVVQTESTPEQAQVAEKLQQGLPH
jgi:predicted PurR-regulated permease PerM